MKAVSCCRWIAEQPSGSCWVLWLCSTGVGCGHRVYEEVWVLQQEGVTWQSISFGGVEHGTTPGAIPNPTPAAAGAPPGLLTLQGHRADKTVSSTPCLAGGAEDNHDHGRERVTPQLVPETAAHHDGKRQERGDEHMQGQDEEMRESAVSYTHLRAHETLR